MKGKFWNTSDLPAIEEVIDTLLKGLAKPDTKAVVIGLHGDLGAGKTTFVQMLARKLKVEEVVTSPTFVVMKNYATKDPVWQTLVHIDAYRLETPEELLVLGFEDVLKTPNTLVCIEWAEKVKALLPPETTHLNFELTGAKRQIEIL